MTFNISAEDLCSNNNIKNVTHIIKSVNPDIIGIQETCCYDEDDEQYTDINSYKIISDAMRTGANTIALYGMDTETGGLTTQTLTNGGAIGMIVNLAW